MQKKIFFHKKILIIDLVHSVGMYRHEFCRKTASGRDWALGRDPKRPKKPKNDSFYAL